MTLARISASSHGGWVRPRRVAGRGATIVAVCLLMGSWQVTQAQARLARHPVAELGGQWDGICGLLRVSFTFAVRYVRHEPVSSGRVLYVHLWPLLRSYSQREDVVSADVTAPPSVLGEAVVDVRYDGADPTGPLLQVEFTREVNFEVRQGRDFRSVEVLFSPGDITACGSGVR